MADRQQGVSPKAQGASILVAIGTALVPLINWLASGGWGGTEWGELGAALLAALLAFNGAFFAPPGNVVVPVEPQSPASPTEPYPPQGEAP